jgi:PAS domain S-box-containing protein
MSSELLGLGKIFDSFAQLSMDGIWLLDDEGRILEANQAVCKFLGYSREELLTMGIKDVEAIETPEQILRTIARLKKKGVGRIERTHRRKDGVLVPVEINATYLERNGYHVTLACIRDLTKQKIFEKNAALHNMLLRLSTAKTGRQEFLDAVVAQIKEWCGAQMVALGLAQEPDGMFAFISLAGSQSSFKGCGAHAQARPEQCLCYRIFHNRPEPQDTKFLTSGGSFYCNNLPQFFAGLSDTQRAKYQVACLKMSPVAMALLPLRYQGDLLGVLFLAGDEAGQVSRPAVDFLESMTPLVAEGIARHSMEAELERNLQKQGVINRLLSLALEDLPLDELLRRSLELLTTLPWIALESKGAVFLVEEHADMLVMRAHQGLPEPIIQQCTQVPFGRCLCGRAAASHAVHFSAKCDEFHEIGYHQMPSHGHYCIPIRHGERVLGVLNLYVKAGHRRTVSEEDFLVVVAQTLAGIIVRQEAEEARRRANQELSLLVRNTPAIVCKGLLDGSVVFSDDKVEQMLGYPREEFDQRRIKWTDLILPEDREQAEQIFLKALKGSNSYVREYRMRRKAGDIIWVQERSQIVYNAQGETDYVSAVVFDITKRKQGEDALRVEKETAQRYLDIAPVIFAVVDMTGTITLINKTGCELLGYSEEHILGRNYVDFIPQARRNSLVPLFQGWLSGERNHSGYVEAPLFTKDGQERLIAWRSVSLKNNAGECTACLAAGEDITERRRAEEALQDTVKRLHRTLEGTVTGLATAVETRDPYTAGHQRGVAQLAYAIGEEMGFAQDHLEGLRVMGFLHDIGKIAVPAEILSKPGRLTEYEFNIVKFHSKVSYDILKEVDFPWPVALAVLQHHEKLDGSGYPHGLTGDDIILEARILTVADVVEAMASHRPYRAALGVERAIEEISKQRGILYDPEVVDACLKILQENRVEF